MAAAHVGQAMTDSTSVVAASALLEVAYQAGRIILKHAAQRIESTLKADSSPVTQADHDAETYILEQLAKIAPQVPVISEEATASGHVPDVENRFFLVDPLDGTKEFLKGNGEYTVNIALIDNGRPVLGVVYAPAKRRMFFAPNSNEAWELDDAGTRLRQLHARALSPDGVTALISRSHHACSAPPPFVGAYPVKTVHVSGSSIKFCLIAAGEGDVYPRDGKTMEWDTAAGHAVLAAAGGSVTLADAATTLNYGKRDAAYANPPFIAWGKRV